MTAFALAVLAPGCSTMLGKDCVNANENTWDIQEPAAPSLQLKVEDCRIDGGACGALCVEVLSDEGDGGTITECTVRFDGSTVHVTIGYDTETDDEGCAIPDGSPTGGL